MHIYLARNGFNIWMGEKGKKEKIAQFIPIGNGIYSFSTDNDKIAKTLETHPFYKGVLSRPDKITVNVPTSKEKLVIDTATVRDERTGGELKMPVEILVPSNIDCFYKTEEPAKVTKSKVLAGAMTSENSIKGRQEKGD